MNPNVTEPRFEHIHILFVEKDGSYEDVDVDVKTRQICKEKWGDAIEFTDNYVECPFSQDRLIDMPEFMSPCFRVHCCLYRNFVCRFSIPNDAVYALDDHMNRIMPVIDEMIALREKAKKFKELMSMFKSIEIIYG
jgi:hypothetical protein